MDEQVIPMLSSLQAGDAFEVQFVDGTVTLHRVMPDIFEIVHPDGTRAQMRMNEIPEWAASLDEQDVLGFGVVKNMNGGARRRRLNMSGVRNGRANVITNNTEFINSNFMPLNSRPTNTKNYIYLESELRGGKAVRAYHQNGLKSLQANATNPFTRAALRESNFRRVV